MKGFGGWGISEPQTSNASLGDDKSFAKRISKYLRKELLIVIVIVVTMRYATKAELFNPASLEGFLDELGIIAPIAFILLCALTVPAFIPPLLFIGLGSLAFGHVIGAFYSLLGITIGACVAFLLGRYVIPNFAHNLRQGHWRLAKIDAWFTIRNNAICIFLLRLILPGSSMLNYVLSTMQITTTNYLFGTFFGFIPRTIIVANLFDLLMKRPSFHEIIVNPYLLSLPIIRVVGLILLVAFTRGASKDVV